MDFVKEAISKNKKKIKAEQQMINMILPFQGRLESTEDILNTLLNKLPKSYINPPANFNKYSYIHLHFK